MKPRHILAGGLAAWVLLVGCMPSFRSPDEAAPATDEPSMTASIDTISRDAMKACLEDSGQVAIVQVTQARVIGAGTRSERAAVKAVVEDVLYGELAGDVELGRYTSGGDALMEAGQRYVVAVNAVPVFPADYLIAAFVAVPAGQVEEAAEAHRRLIAELGY